LQHVPSIPENAPFNTRQRLWLNGYLAGLFAASAGPAVPGEPPARTTVPVLILFGSQPGEFRRNDLKTSSFWLLFKGNVWPTPI